MTFIVPSEALPTVSVISREAAYLVFGFGAAKPWSVEPWSDPGSILIRDGTSGTQRMIGEAIKVDADLWRGAPFKSSSKLLAALSAKNNESVAKARRRAKQSAFTTS
jgi:hypothetical protein